MKRFFSLGLTVLTFLALCAPAEAKLKTGDVIYKQGDKVFEGFIAYDDRFTGKRPGVLVVHEWFGLGDYAKQRAKQLAELGYIAFAADMYGKGVRAKNGEEASKLATEVKGDRALMRARANAALGVLSKYPQVDSGKLAAIGYCFGGTTALELARSGAPLVGIVSFHGALDTPNLQDAKQVKGKVLVLHGGDDPYVPQKDVDTFQSEMRQAGVDWQFVSYGGAVHSFTNPAAGNDNSKGAAYNEKADHRSWEAMKAFFGEIF